MVVTGGFHPPKVAVVGTGFVGSTFAYALMMSGLASEIVLIDADNKRAEGEAMDLNHGSSFVAPVRIWAGDYTDCKDADIVAISAGAAQKPDEKRLELVHRNFEVFRNVVPMIAAHNKNCILLIATNPVDIMTYAAWKLSGFPPNRVIGSGTILDTSRLRFVLGEHLNIDPRNVHAYIIGEHGDSEVPVWSLANVAGTPLQQFCLESQVTCDRTLLDNLFNRVKNAAYEIIERKGRTYYAIGLGLTRIAESILRNENAILTVSSLLHDYYGLSGICLSVPSIVNREGVKTTLKVPLNTNELESFHKSASVLREIASSLNL